SGPLENNSREIAQCNERAKGIVKNFVNHRKFQHCAQGCTHPIHIKVRLTTFQVKHQKESYPAQHLKEEIMEKERKFFPQLTPHHHISYDSLDDNWNNPEQIIEFGSE